MIYHRSPSETNDAPFLCVRANFRRLLFYRFVRLTSSSPFISFVVKNNNGVDAVSGMVWQPFSPLFVYIRSNFVCSCFFAIAGCEWIPYGTDFEHSLIIINNKYNYISFILIHFIIHTKDVRPDTKKNYHEKFNIIVNDFRWTLYAP